MTSSVKVEESELMALKNAQQADPVLMKLLELPEGELKRRNFGISPQAILVKVEDKKQRPVVPQEMQQKTLQENHDVSAVGMWGSSGRWTWSNICTGGENYGVIRLTTCSHVRCVSE